MWSESSIFCVTADENGNKQMYKGFSGLKGAELLDEMKDCAKYVVGEGVKFDRIRRITGYLVGTLDRFNNAKKAEVNDRVTHATE